MLAAAQRVAAFLETGDADQPGRAFAGAGVVIVENFAPYLFEGPDTVARWASGMRAHLTGVTALRHAFGHVGLCRPHRVAAQQVARAEAVGKRAEALTLEALQRQQ